jgi:hypothetical protein
MVFGFRQSDILFLPVKGLADQVKDFPHTRPFIQRFHITMEFSVNNFTRKNEPSQA